MNDDTDATRLRYHHALTEGGLTQHQAKMYEAVLKHGTQTASKLARLSGVPRTLGYKALQELQALGLVEKDDAPGRVARFSALHPFKLKEVVDKRYGQAKDAKDAIDNALSKMISDFNTMAGAPGVRILEGLSGIAELYEDELNERQPIKLIRSPEDDTFTEIRGMILKQITEQVRLGIRVRVIAPFNPYTQYQHDKERLIERRILPAELFAIKAQIAIYGNKVAITSYNPLMTTLIESEPIRQTFELIFNHLWESIKPEYPHDKNAPALVNEAIDAAQ